MTTRHLPALFFYALFFLALFLQFPLHHSLPGNTDTWYSIALSNTFWDKLAGVFTGDHPGSSMYPEMNVLRFGESSIGGAMIFLFYKLLGSNDIWAYYFYISTIFILNAFGVYLLAMHYRLHILASVFAGFAFACSNFMLANIDDSIVLLFFIPMVAVIVLRSYLEQRRPGQLLLLAVLAGIQIYFSFYVFAGQFVLYGAVLAVNYRKVFTQGVYYKLAAALVLVVLLIIPWLVRYRFLITGQFINPLEWSAEEMSLHPYSLHFNDLFNHLPGNPIYSLHKQELPHFYLIRLNAFLGFGVYALALAALIRIKRPEVKEMALLILFGMLLAFRPVNKIIYDLFPPLYAIRGALRFFVISSAGISLMAALTLHTVMPYLKKAWMIALLALGMLTFHFLENITFPLLRFESGDLYRPAASYLEYFKSRPQTVILNLPSNNPFGIRPVRFEKGFTERLFGYNRETIYMNHQTYHRKNIINGNNGYFPASRLVTQRLVDRIAEDSAIDSLMMMGMEYVVFHKYLVVEPEEDNLPLLLSRPEYFRPEYEDQDIVIFTVRKSGEGSF